MDEQHFLDLNVFRSSVCVFYALASSELFLVFFQNRTFLEFAVCGVCVWGFLVLFFAWLVAFVVLFVYLFLNS